MGLKSAALYIRVSTDDQTEYSPQAQLKALKDYATKNNLFIADKHIFIDEGFSGRRAEKRPAFQKMISIAKLKPTPFEVILVHKFDRFSRNREDSVVYKSLLRKECGIKVISITEQLEDDKFSIILESMLEAMAEYYSLNLADEVKKGMTEKAKKGGYQSCPPFGYSINLNNLKVIPDEAKIVKLIFDKFVYENMSYYTIAKLINTLNVKTHRGNNFENRTVEYILNNPVYIGMVRWNPSGKTNRDYNNPNLIISPGDHEPIISKKLFNLAQNKISNLKKLSRRKKRPPNEYTHWLSGMVRCSNCSSSLVYTKAKYPYFQCRGYTGGKCNISHAIVVTKLEASIKDKIKEDMKNLDDVNFEIVNITDTERDIELLNTQLKRIPQKLFRAKESYIDGIDTIKEYKVNKERILNEEKYINNRIKDLESKTHNNKVTTDLKNRIQNAYDLLNSSNITNAEKSSLLNSFVKQIIFDKPNNSLIIEYYINNSI